MVKVRETIWPNADALWILSGVAPASNAPYLSGLDHLAGFPSRKLLISLQR